MVDVVFYEVFAEEERSLKKYLGDKIKADYRAHPLQVYCDDTPPAALLSIRTHSRIPSDWEGKIKGVLTRSSGYDHLIEWLERTKGGIQCGYLANYCARSVAEHAVAVLFCLLKQLKKQMDHFSTFNRNELTGRDCLNKNLLVIGVGKIGFQIVQLTKGIGMHVKGIDLVERMPGLEYTELRKGIPWADVVVCALPLTDKTKGLLNFSVLSQMRKQGIFINISRGEIAPLRDLAELLDAGVLGGIGLDVFENENLLRAHLQDDVSSLTEDERLVFSLKDKSQVVFTPHNAFNTEESLDQKARQACESIQQFLKTGHFLEEVPFEASECTAP